MYSYLDVSSHEFDCNERGRIADSITSIEFAPPTQATCCPGDTGGLRNCGFEACFADTKQGSFRDRSVQKDSEMAAREERPQGV
jgi:hypothetical protein